MAAEQSDRNSYQNGGRKMIHVVVNPAGAGGRSLKLWQTLETAFLQSGKPYQVHYSTLAKGIEDLCREISETVTEKTDLVVIGGDGTLNQVLNGLTDLSLFRIGLIPCGSANDLAKDLDLPKETEKITDTILDGKQSRYSDVGLIEMLNIKGEVIGKRRFLGSSGFGFDAAVCHEVEETSRKNLLNKVGLGKLIYLFTAIRILFSQPLLEAEVTLENGEKKQYLSFKQALLLAVMNHRFEGGGFMFAPDASPEDGLLDLCAAEPKSRWQFFRIFPTAFKGNHVKFPCVTMEKAKAVEIRTSSPVWLHADGEPFAKAAWVRISILPEKAELSV